MLRIENNNQTQIAVRPALASAGNCEKMRSVLAHLGSAWAFLKENDRPILILFALVGGIYTVIEYRTKNQSEKDLAVARFVEYYGTSELLKARVDFNAFLNSPEARALKPDTYDEFMKAKTDDDRVFRDISAQLSFFDSLSICAISGSCSHDISCKYFFKGAEEFLQNTRPILAELGQREKQPIDQLVVKFANEICIEQHKTYCALISFSGSNCTALRPMY